jgi:hypothetical protein
VNLHHFLKKHHNHCTLMDRCTGVHYIVCCVFGQAGARPSRASRWRSTGSPARTWPWATSACPPTIRRPSALPTSATDSSASSSQGNYVEVLGIRDILVRIRIRGSASLDFKDAKKLFFFIFSCNLPTAALFSVLKIRFFLLKFWVKILFCKHYFIKGKDPDPYL